MELNLPLEANSADKPVLCFGEFQLDRQLRTLRRGAEQLKLAAKPFATLEFLIENRSRVVPKSELLREVWGAQQEVNTVEQAVRHVRKALADGPLKPRYIETTPGQGYRFIADVHGQEPDAPMLRQEGRRPSRRDVLIAAGVGAPLVCLGGFAAVRLLWRPEHVARVAINGTSLIATSATGSILWTYGFNEPLAEAPAETAGWRTQMVDLNADGQPESLVTVAFASAPAHPAEILCFTSTGKLLWRYRPQVAGLRFNKRDLNGPWKFTDVVLVPGMPTAIWAAVAHDVWWPSLVIRLSDTGMHELALVNSGVIFKLHAFQNGTGSYIMAAGVNNEYQLAALAILRSSGPPATSPQNDEGSDFYCVAGCPKGKPYRYILMPRSEFSKASDTAYDIANNIDLRPSGTTVQVQTQEKETETCYYDFSQDFEPERVAYSSTYRARHEMFERDGRIRHSYHDCPERKEKAVLRICDEVGNWREVAIPRLLPPE